MKTIIVSRAKRLESFINLSLLSQTNGTGTGFESMNQQSVACREAAAAARTDVVRADARTCPTGAVAVRRGRRGNTPVARGVAFAGPRRAATVRRTTDTIPGERRYARA
jgi:hypothetical protein